VLGEVRALAAEAAQKDGEEAGPLSAALHQVLSKRLAAKPADPKPATQSQPVANGDAAKDAAAGAGNQGTGTENGHAEREGQEGAGAGGQKGKDAMAVDQDGDKPEAAADPTKAKEGNLVVKKEDPMEEDKDKKVDDDSVKQQQQGSGTSEPAPPAVSQVSISYGAAVTRALSWTTHCMSQLLRACCYLSGFMNACYSGV
jgi:hypothetical protein